MNGEMPFFVAQVKKLQLRISKGSRRSLGRASETKPPWNFQSWSHHNTRLEIEVPLPKMKFRMKYSETSFVIETYLPFVQENWSQSLSHKRLLQEIKNQAKCKLSRGTPSLTLSWMSRRKCSLNSTLHGVDIARPS